MSSMFSGIGDWLRSPMTGMGPGQGGTAGPGGNPTRLQGLGNVLAGAGRSIAGGGTAAAGMGQAMGQANQQAPLQQGSEEERLWAMLQKLVAQRGLPGQNPAAALAPAAPSGMPPMGGRP